MNTNEERKRTTRLARVLIAVISALMLFSLLVLFTFAADSTSPYDAQFGELYYENLSDAIEAANSSASGGTVTVLRDVNLSECLTISKDVTLTGKYTIYRADSYTAGLFTVDAGVTLTLDGGITIDGGNEWVLDYDLYLADIKTGAFLPSGKTYVKAKSGAPIATDYMINIYGSVIMNNATVQNNYGTTSEKTSAFCLHANSSLTMNDGATARHNYITGNSSLVACNERGAVWTINSGAEITDNSSYSGSGLISYMQRGHIEMNGGEIHHNYGTACEGSVFVLRYGGSFTMNDGYIHDNYSFIMTGKWGGTISIKPDSDSAIPKYSTFTMNGGVMGPNYGTEQTTLVGNGFDRPCIYLNGGKIINVDGYCGAPGTYYYYSSDTGIMENGVIEGGTIKVRLDMTSHGTIDSEVRFHNKKDANFVGDGGTVNGNIYINTETAGSKIYIKGTTLNGDLVLNEKANAVIQGGTYNGDIIISSGGKLTVESGSFKSDPTAYLAAGSQSFYDAETGLYTVYSGNVASFGGAEYATLAEAIAAANAVGGGEVSLLRSTYISEKIDVSSNITLTGDYVISRAKAPLENYTGTLFNVSAGATLTLDGGVTIDGGNYWSFDKESYVYDMENVKLYDSSKTYVTAESGAPVATDSLVKVYGSVNVNESTIQNNYGSSAIYTYSGGSVTMNSGALAKNNYKNGLGAVVYSALGSTVTVNEGVEMCENVTKDNATVIYLEGTLTMNGGEVHHNYNIGSDGSFILMRYGAEFTLNDGYIHDNYSFTDNSGAAIAMYYQSDSDGNNGAKLEMNGGTIGPNYGNAFTTFYGNSWTNLKLYVNGGKIINVDGTYGTSGSYIYFSTDSYFGENAVIEGGTFDIRMCIINKAVVNGDVRVMYNIARMFDGGGTINGDMIFDFAGVNNKNAIFYNGTVNGDVVLKKTAFVSILNGVFNGDVIAPSGSKLAISDGIYNGTLDIAEGATLTITGGIFKDDPSAYLADYYETSYDEASGYYTVSKYYEASFGDTNYDSLEEAIAAANTAGGRVTLLHDVDLDTSITVSSDVEIYGDYTILRSDSYTGNLFTVSAGANLTLDGGVVIDGGNSWTVDMDALNTILMSDGNNSASLTVVSSESGVVATASIFSVSGDVVMNKSTIRNHYTAADAVALFDVLSGGSLTMNNGASITHNCSTAGDGIILIKSGAGFTINDGAEISYNHSQNAYSIIWVNGNAEMNGGKMHHNTVFITADLGALIVLVDGGIMTVNDGSLCENTYVVPSNKYSASVLMRDNTTFIMNGGVIEKNHGNSSTGVYAYAPTSVLTLNSGAIYHESNTVSKDPSSYSQGIITIGDDFIMDGGIFRMYKNSSFDISGTLNVELQIARVSGDFDFGGTLNGRLLVYDKSSITVTGGTYLGGFKIYSGVTFEIEGGSFRENPTDWTAEGYHAVYSKETELYTVILTPVASIDGAKYDTLAEAVAAAEDGDVINVIASHKLADSVTIDKAVTVDMKNQTITLSPAAAAAFVIEAEATFRGDGTVNTDNGNSKVFVIGSESTAGSLTIEDGSYIGESTVAAVENGSLNITGGDFAVNPDVAEGETADHSALLTVSESANTSVAITGGRFRSFNPESAGGGYLEDSHDAVEESGDYYNVLAHLFEHYVSDGNATCTADGTKTAKCKYCELTDTITEVGTKLQHVFLHYISDGNATCTEDGTRTAKCEGCDVTFTIPDTRSALGHSFTDYKSNGDATCKANGTRTAKCDHCEETRTIMEARSKLPHTYDGLKCTACGNLRIWLIAIIAFCCVGLLMFLPLMII